MVAISFATTAFANYCSMDVVPAATLLFPFVVHDYEGGAEGLTTQIAITNVSSKAQIVRLTLWTDFSVAVTNFNIVLTGYDVVRINMRDVLDHGLVPTLDPSTGRHDAVWVDDNSNAGGTPLDWGPWSSHNSLHTPPLTVTGLPKPQSTTPLDCNPNVWISSPINYVEPIPINTLRLIEAFLKSSQTADKGYVDCEYDVVEFPAQPWFLTRDSGPVWMYVTADVVSSCNRNFPDAQATSYFSLDRANSGGVQDDNVLIGDVMWIDDANGTSHAGEAVHLESQPPENHPFPGQVPSFYFRFVDGVTTADCREPLPSAWAIRYQLEEAAGVDTTLRVFKGGSLNRTTADLFTVSGQPPNRGNITTIHPARLFASACVPYTYYAWDEHENVNEVSELSPYSLSDGVVRPIPNLLPLETQEVDIDQFFIVRQSPGSEHFGWLLFIWPGSNGGPIDPSGNPVGDWYQTWVGGKYSRGGGNSTSALTGAVIANYNCDQTQVVPKLAIQRFLPEDR
jgi:hypothetical protein